MKFQVGDEVWCASFGEGVVVQIRAGMEYTCIVTFNKVTYDEEIRSYTETFTGEGRRNIQDVAPSLYHKGVEIIEHEPDRTPKKPDFKPFQRVLVRDLDYRDWSCAIFSHEMPEEDEYRYVCSAERWTQCIPYEGNEHLVGTCDD